MRKNIQRCVVDVFFPVSHRLALLSRNWITRSARHRLRRRLTRRSAALIGALVVLMGALSACGGGGAIYIPPQSARWTVYFGNIDGSVYALNANDGSQRWKASSDTGVNPYFPLTVNDKIVAYVDASGGILPLRADTGGTVKMCQCAVPQSLFSEESPTIVGGVLYSVDFTDNLQAHELGAVGDGQLWSDQLPGTVGHIPVVFGGEVYVASNSGIVYRVDQNTGGNPYAIKTWTSQNDPASANNVSEVAEGDSGVYFEDSDGHLYGYPAGWVGGPQYRLFPYYFNVMASEGAVYAFGATKDDPSAQLSAYNESNGTLRWHFDDPNLDPQYVSWGTPTTASGLVLFSSHANDKVSDILYALDANTGAVRWSYNLGAQDSISLDAPVVQNGSVYFSGYDGDVGCRVYAVNVTDGTLRWRYDIPNPSNFSEINVTRLAVGPDALYIGANLSDGGKVVTMEEGYIYALNLANGSRRWEYDSGAVNDDSPLVVTAPVVGPLVTTPPLPLLQPRTTPNPTLVPTNAPPPVPPRPTPVPTTAPPVVKFAVQPTSFTQTCTASPGLPSLSVTLDNSQSSVAVDWRATITDQDPSKSELWATASPSSGEVGSQRTTQVTVLPASDLCSRFSGNSSAPVTFHVTVTWTTGGGGSATITDSVHPYVIG